MKYRILWLFVFVLAACGGDDGPSAEADAADAAADVADAGVDTAPDVAPDVGVDTPEPDALGEFAVDDIDPATGSTLGRYTVSISGSGFDGRCTTRFGEVAALATGFVTTELLDVTVPPTDDVGAVDVTVRCRGEERTLAGAFTFVAPITPVINGVEPLVGRSAGGELVTFSGTDLVPGTRNVVSFGSVIAETVDYVDDTTIVATTPPVAPSEVSLLVELGEERATIDDTFVFLDEMTLASIEPTFGDARGGTEVTLTGTGFWPFADVEIALGEVVVPQDGLTFAEDGTTVSFVAPDSESLGLVDVTVSTLLDEASLTGAFTWLEPVTIETFAPEAVPNIDGQRVTLTAGGADFDPEADPLTVFVGEAEAFDVTWEDARTLSFLVPDVDPGSYAIELRHGSQTVLSAEELIVYRPIEIIELSVTTGPEAGGTRLDIEGRGFVDGVLVFFGDNQGTEVAVNATNTLLSVTTPAGTAGPVDVTVRTRFSSATAEGAFTYVP